MKVASIKLSLWLLIIGIFTAYLSGCASTKPNTPYPGPYPPIFKELSMKNPLLTQELGKLPEIKDGISGEEAVALEKVVELYNKDPNAFDKAFNEMHKIGKPEVRKYCSPIQALFWLAEDSLLDMETDLISNYSLEKLLSHAWNFDPPAVSDKQISEAINGIKNEKFREQYFGYWKAIGNKRIQKILLVDLKHIKHVVSKDARKIIKSFKSVNPKWSDFATVTERLNAPELVDYYEKRRFDYVRPWEIPEYSKSGNPYWVFKNNKGDCIHTTSFTVYCLKKGGYKAWEKLILNPYSRFTYHSITVFYWNGKKYVMDNGKPFKAGIRTWEEYFH